MDIEIDVELPVTYKCDWDCDYCCAFTHDQPDVIFSELIMTVDSIPPNSNVSITGGEPGLLTKSKLQEVIIKLRSKQCTIDLFTNGLFIKKHPELVDKVDRIVYHCLEYLSDDIQFPNLSVDYIIVVNSEDFDDNILNVMDRYPHIKFRVVPTIILDANNKMYTKFIKFIKEHKDRLHEDTMMEFMAEMVRKPDSIKAYKGD